MTKLTNATQTPAFRTPWSSTVWCSWKKSLGVYFSNSVRSETLPIFRYEKSQIFYLFFCYLLLLSVTLFSNLLTSPPSLYLFLSPSFFLFLSLSTSPSFLNPLFVKIAAIQRLFIQIGIFFEIYYFLELVSILCGSY